MSPEVGYALDDLKLLSERSLQRRGRLDLPVGAVEAPDRGTCPIFKLSHNFQVGQIL